MHEDPSCIIEVEQRGQSSSELKAIAALLVDALGIKRVVDTTEGASPMAAALAGLEEDMCVEITPSAQPTQTNIDLIVTTDPCITDLARFWQKRVSSTGALLVDMENNTLHNLLAQDVPYPTAQILNGRYWLVSIGDFVVRFDQTLLQLLESPHGQSEEVNSQSAHGASMAIQSLLPRAPGARRLLPIQYQSLAQQWRESPKAASTLLMLKTNLESERKTIAALNDRLRYEQDKNHRLLKSHSWRITAPLRFITTLLRFSLNIARNWKVLSSAVLRVLRSRGLIHGSKHLIGRLLSLQSIQSCQLMQQWRPAPVYDLPLPPAALQSLHLRVLIVAEMSVPQCLKYRVLQKQRMILDLGYDCTVVSWADVIHVRDSLQTHNVAIFYRVPGYPEQLDTILAAKSMGVKTYWEVDDLIFDSSHYLKNSNVQSLPARTQKAVLNSVPLYRQAMLACGDCIASTSRLAEEMIQAGALSAVVIENGLDLQTLSLAEEIRSSPSRSSMLIRIVYGSGTLTHDADFKVAAPAILAMLKRYDHVILTVIGHLNLPSAFDDYKEKIETIALSDYSTYMRRLASCQISIAPLEDSIFNDAKSNIKFLEAAILSLPSVCSPAAAFKEVIQSGVTGYLAANEGQWRSALQALIEDASLRQKIGQNALDYVKQRYLPEYIRDNQLLPLIRSNQKFSPQRRRILGVNIFLEPRSFGGATIVVEELARVINQGLDFEYGLFTTLPCTDVHPYKLIRYQASVGETFAIGLPHETDPVLGYDNPYLTEAFRTVLKAWRPDIVHFHSIQGIGVQIADVCQQEGIPYLVTLHDVWWICARQFMINQRGRYCEQTKIDLSVCLQCAPHRQLVYFRHYRLLQVLQDASLCLAPSRFTCDQYIDNGVSADKITVNKNGVRFPAQSIKRTPPSTRKLSFGYVGGEEVIKGAELIKKAFASLEHDRYELRVVDNLLNLNQRSIFASHWPIKGKLHIIPAYTQASMDDFYSQIDVLLFPTQWKESFGLAVREALVRDVWVIATDAGGVSEDIVDQTNGFIIPFHDDGTQLAACIRQLLDHPSRLDHYENPFKSRIRSFSDQAQELVTAVAAVLNEARTQ